MAHMTVDKDTETKKIDLRKQFRYLYNPSSHDVSVVEVPETAFLMVDGEGNPNTAESYVHAIQALYAVAYAAKFLVKRSPAGVDYAVMPLEGLWWTDDMSQFRIDNKDAWKWTMMIAQPEVVTEEVVEEACQSTAKQKDLPALASLRFGAFREGRAAQILYIGSYADEGPTIERIHRFIADQGHRLRGKHHEIYLGDPRRTAPEKLKTVIRQPFE